MGEVRGWGRAGPWGNGQGESGAGDEIEMREEVEVCEVEVCEELYDLPYCWSESLPYEPGGWAVPLSCMCL